MVRVTQHGLDPYCLGRSHLAIFASLRLDVVGVLTSNFASLGQMLLVPWPELLPPLLHAFGNCRVELYGPSVLAGTWAVLILSLQVHLRDVWP